MPAASTYRLSFYRGAKVVAMPLELFNKAEQTRLNQFPKPLPVDDLQTYYYLSVKDIELIMGQRRDASRLGFALQLYALRHLGFVPANLTEPPSVALHFVADQLAIAATELSRYQRQATQNKHLHQVMNYLDFRRATPLDEAALEPWLLGRALEPGNKTL